MLTSFLLKKHTILCFIFFILFVVLGSVSVFGQCPEGDVIFRTQEEVDAFVIDYPNCTKVIGDMIIQHSSITNLFGLQRIDSIEGSLIISSNKVISNLKGLEKLNSIGEDLRIQHNEKLSNLSGLENLNSVDGEMIILNNTLLTNLNELVNLVFFDGFISIYENASIVDVMGLKNLKSIKGFYITDNSQLINLSGLENLNSEVGGLVLSNNSLLVNFPTFTNINSISGYLEIADNPNLLNLKGLKNLSSIEGHLKISNNKSLANLQGLENLSLVSGNFGISDNDILSSLSALANLSSIGGYLKISNNSSLLNLVGLENLTTISGILSIESNEMITDMSSLQNLIEVGGLGIYAKSNLVNHLFGLENIKSVAGTLDISDTHLREAPFFKNITSVGRLNIIRNDNVTDLSGLANLTSVGSVNIENSPLLNDLSFLKHIDVLDNLEIKHNKGLKNLSGIENLDTVRSNLNIHDNNSLQNFVGLKNLVKVGGHFSVRLNNSIISFKGLSNLQLIEGDFLVVENHSLIDFTGLEKLTEIGGNFRVGGGLVPYSPPYYDGYFFEGNNALTSFKGLNDLTSVRGYFKIAHLPALTSLNGLENITSIGVNSHNTIGLYITDNLLLTNLKGLDALTKIAGPLRINSNINLSNLSGLENLKTIGKSLSITNNRNLIDISALENTMPEYIILNICDNPSLSSCNTKNICNFFSKSEKWFTIENNYTGCNSASEISENCNRAKIQTQFFYDLNKNKQYDNNEPYASFGAMMLNPGNIKIIQNPKTGYGIWYATPGNFTLNIDEASIANSILTTDSVTYQLDLSQGDCQTLNIGVYPNQPISEMRSFMYSPNARCNETIPFDLLTKNWGTTKTKGTLWFKADAHIQSFQFFEEPDTLIEPNQYGWFFDGLMPSEYLTKQIDVAIPGIGQVEVGQKLSFESYAEFTDDNGEQFSTSVFNYQTPVRCSYDPNDKLVNPNRTCSHILMDENITYTIRFQNTGNDVAYKVSITDEIDANLDLNTFSLINSSHIDSLQTSITDNGTVTFQFNNINLPDSTSNLEGSQGYVSYSIKAKTDLPENTVIKNTSAIYFDYNPPIITNTVENVLVSELPNLKWCRDFNENGLGDPNESVESCERPEGYVMDCSDPNDLVNIYEASISDLVSVFPNPTNGVFRIDVGVSHFRKVTFSLFNAQGELLIETTNLNNQQQLEYPNLTNGIYYLKIRVDDLILRKKLVVMK